MLFYGARIDEIYRTVPLPSNLTLLFLKAEALNHFGVLILVAVWRRVIGNQIERFSFLNNYQEVGRQLPQLVYVAALVLQIAQRLGGQEFGALSQVFSITYQFGVVSIFFVSSTQGNRYRQVGMAVFLAIPLAILALGGGVKEAVIFPLVPAVLIVWFRFRSISMKVLMVVLGIVLLAYLQLYTKYVREATWGTHGTNYSTMQLLDGFGEHMNNATLADGMDSINSRINMTVSRAMTIAVADARGFEPYNIFAPIPASLVPRLFWPDKPVLMPGAQHTLRLLGSNLPADRAGSATAPGFFSELYLGGGFAGWALGAISYAMILGIMQRYTLRRTPGFGHLALSFLTVYWAVRFEEKAVVYAYTGLFFTFVFLMLLAKATSFLKRQNSRIR